MKNTLFAFAFVFAASSMYADPVASDDFSGSELSKNWKAAKGTWTVVDGKLNGAELAADKHAAVLSFVSKHTESKSKVSFQLNGSKGFHLSFNHPKGHLYRVIVSETGVQINLDKDKKDPASKAMKLAKEEASFEQGKTYTMTSENVGDTVKVEFDNGVKVEAMNENLTKPKTGYRFIIKGEGVIFDDFAILSSK